MEPEGISPREISRVVPRINDSSLEPEGSGDFFIPAPYSFPRGEGGPPERKRGKSGSEEECGQKSESLHRK